LEGRKIRCTASNRLNREKEENDMPFAANAGVHIHYEVEGVGPPLVCLHGLSWSAESWRQAGYVEGLKAQYQVILIDVRGHGASDKPHAPEAYGLDLLTADVVSVLDDLKIYKAACFGYSMGGWIALGMARYAGERLSSLMIGGYGPHEKWPPERRALFIQYFSQEMEAFLKASRDLYEKVWTPEFQAVVAANDLRALTALVSSAEFLSLPGLAGLLASVAVPCLFFAGEEDGSRLLQQEWVSRVPNAAFVSIPGLNHYQAGIMDDLVLPHITRFLTQASQARISVP
jgi:pimeloyl-ACP methyl ester carboxylesterase